MSPSEAHAPEEEIVPAADTERRSRRVLVLTSVLTVLVIAGVIALGLAGQERREAERERRAREAARAYSVADIYGDPMRNTPWPDAGCAPDRDHPPELVFLLPGGELDFGVVKQGVVLDRVVEFRNDGVGPLCIRRIERNCGCIQADFEDDVRRFEPGDVGRIRVVLNTRGRMGPVTKNVTLYTNSPDVPRQSMAVKADVSKGLVVSGSLLNFGRATSGRKAHATVQLRSARDESDWTVESVTGTVRVNGSPLDYAFELREIADPVQRVVEVVVEHPGYAHEGPYRFDDRITIRTSHPDRPEIQAEGWLMVVPPIRAQPPRAVFGYVPNGKPIRIRIVPGEPRVTFQVLAIEVVGEDGMPVEAEDAGFTATFGPAEAGIWWVDVRYDDRPRPSGQSVRRTLIVRTDSREVPEVRVACFARVS